MQVSIKNKRKPAWQVASMVWILLVSGTLACPVAAQKTQNTSGNLLLPNDAFSRHPRLPTAELPHITNSPSSHISCPSGTAGGTMSASGEESSKKPGVLTPTTTKTSIPTEAAVPAALPLSASCQELVRQMGVLPLILKLTESRAITNKGAQAASELAELSIKQQLTDNIIVAMLEVRGASAAINREICETNELASFLSDRRDKRVLINSIANFTSGGIAEIAGGGLQLSTREPVQSAGNMLEIIGGGLQTGLSLLALRQQRGEQRSFESDPNMLAKLFDFTPDADSDFPPTVWTYLNSVPPGAKNGLTRRQHLLSTWIKLGRVTPGNRANLHRALEQLASASSQRQQVNIDMLSSRAAMLSDLGAVVAEIDTLLLELMQYVSRPG